jgi:nucleotide-binding universal stress UspA family protein
MFPFRKILFPIDYSEPCQAVVPYVKEMVRHFSADLTLVHAYGPEALASSDLAITNPDLPEEVRILTEQRLREFALMFPGTHVETIVELGEPGGVIHRVVQRQGTDVVMLATHGRGLIRRFLLGSVAAKVLHDVSAAVWTGTGSLFEGHTPRIPYTSVLCALDLGKGDEEEEAEAVLTAAAAFASGYKARLSLVHVVETPPVNLVVDFSPYKKDLMDAADVKLRELKGNLGLDVPHAVIDAGIPEGIRQEAVRRNADLIITGRGQAQATFHAMWSRLYPIVRQSPCPVLSI